MKLSEIQDHQKVICRVGRWNNLEGVVWGPWSEEELYVKRRNIDLSKKERKNCSYWKKGDIVGLTPRSRNWAEATQGDFQPFVEGGIFNVGNYYLQIRDLEA